MLNRIAQEAHLAPLVHDRHETVARPEGLEYFSVEAVGAVDISGEKALHPVPSDNIENLSPQLVLGKSDLAATHKNSTDHEDLLWLRITEALRVTRRTRSPPLVLVDPARRVSMLTFSERGNTYSLCIGDRSQGR